MTSSLSSGSSKTQLLQLDGRNGDVDLSHSFFENNFNLWSSDSSKDLQSLTNNLHLNPLDSEASVQAAEVRLMSSPPNVYRRSTAELEDVLFRRRASLAASHLNKSLGRIEVIGALDITRSCSTEMEFYQSSPIILSSLPTMDSDPDIDNISISSDLTHPLSSPLIKNFADLFESNTPEAAPSLHLNEFEVEHSDGGQEQIGDSIIESQDIVSCKVLNESQISSGIKSRDIAMASLWSSYGFLISSKECDLNGRPIREVVAERGGFLIENIAALYKGHERIGLQSITIVMITSTSARTKKFVSSLALGIPIVSHSWISRCILANRAIDYNSFRIASEYSTLLNRIVYFGVAGPKGVFSKKRVYIFPGVKNALNEGITNVWAEVLRYSGAELISRLEFLQAYKCDFCLCLKEPPPNEVDLFGCKLVTKEFIFHCLIEQKLWPRLTHPAYYSWS